MNLLWWIAGGLLAAIWVDRARDARQMNAVPDLTAPEWDRDPLVSARMSGTVPEVTVVVPARNEQAHIKATTSSLLQQDYPRFNVVAVDDRSTDETGAIMEQFANDATARERLHVLHIAELPEGWLGKTHAMWTAAQQTDSEWLLFTDGDVVFRSDTLRRAIAYAEESRADHMVIFPRVGVETFGGRMMLAFFQMLFVFGHRPWKVPDPNSKDSIGFGPFNLIRRSAYVRIGTWKALRMAVVEDMKLGELVKQAGLKSRCAFGMQLVTHHWARTGGDVVRNLEKNFFAVMEYRPMLALVGCTALLFLNLLPFAGVALAPGWAKIPFALALAGIAGLYAGMARRSETSALFFLTHPVATVLFVYTMLRSMAHVAWHGGVVWRGTKYSLHELRKAAAGTEIS
ncbi:MAG TPA: glycosyltransferase [Terriglobales bacterium]|nr:glycosyltransferase [Terriglobales bacterium]